MHCFDVSKNFIYNISTFEKLKQNDMGVVMVVLEETSKRMKNTKEEIVYVE
jgi:hypothetical protein